ncbi:MAG TPA: hypothetical protein VLC48_04580 [Gemmatimonadota bacterium]|nr:hypothetical protein [Gemmatimonadota bacterium]
MIEERLRAAYSWLFRVPAAAGRPHCVGVDELLELAERQAAAGRQLRLLDHVMSCAECHREFALLRSLRAGAQAPEAS